LDAYVSTLDRRRFLAGSAGAGAAAIAGPAAASSPATAIASQPQFHHGVASGDPLPHAVVLWTRVTPTPAATPGSGAGPRVRVHWEVARDARFRRVVRSGVVPTSAARDHTVKVDATRLPHDTWLYYRFRCGSTTSPVGRTRTMPDEKTLSPRMRLGVVSCSNWQAGFFSPYRHLADRDDLDFVLHLGDYVYEYAPGQYGYGQSDRDIRTHLPRHEMVTLADYRRRFAQYRTDPDLQRLHQRLPWITTWDDHEVANDMYRTGAENHQPETEGGFLERRDAARRAYDEWMPIRLSGSAVLRDGHRAYRRLSLGSLADIFMLDLRTYRSEQVRQYNNEQIADPARTILGDGQEGWLTRGLKQASPTSSQDPTQTGVNRWKLVGNPVMITPVQLPPLPVGVTPQQLSEITGISADNREGVPFNSDSWDGYAADRRQVLDFIADNGVQDVVFLTGDIHSSWACNVPRDPGTYRLNRNSAAVELVCTSVTSNNLDDITGGPPGSSLPVEEAFKKLNPHVKHLNFDDHGYSVLEVTPTRLQMDWFTISDRKERNATSKHLISFGVRAGTQRCQRVEGPLR